MFIVSVDGYHVPFIINHIHYLNCHLDSTKCNYCHYDHRHYCYIEHYILNLSSGPDVQMEEFANINTQIGIHYMKGEIKYQHDIQCMLTRDKIVTVNKNMFARVRNKFLYDNKFKCIWIKQFFKYLNLNDVYYIILKIIIQMDDIEFLKPNTKIYINNIL